LERLFYRIYDRAMDHRRPTRSQPGPNLPDEGDLIRNMLKHIDNQYQIVFSPASRGKWACMDGQTGFSPHPCGNSFIHFAGFALISFQGELAQEASVAAPDFQNAAGHQQQPVDATEIKRNTVNEIPFVPFFQGGAPMDGLIFIPVFLGVKLPKIFGRWPAVHRLALAGPANVIGFKIGQPWFQRTAAPAIPDVLELHSFHNQVYPGLRVS